MPDFFVVGAPRCATTAMHSWLSAHPEVFLPRKEIHFFGTDLTHRRAEISRSDYQSLFESASSDQRILGEVAVWYLLSETACHEIHAVAPQARILIHLRRPDEMLHSLHAQLLYAGEEELEAFSDALAAEADRKAGRRIPNSRHLGFYAPPVECLLYREVASFGTQVARYIDTFGRDRVHVVFFDDVVEHPGRVFAEVCEFLGVDPTVKPDLGVVNSSRHIRSRVLRDCANTLRWSGLRKATPEPLRAVGARVFDMLLQLNTRVGDRERLDPEIARVLLSDLSSEIDLLESRLERDLSAWRTPAES